PTSIVRDTAPELHTRAASSSRRSAPPAGAGAGAGAGRVGTTSTSRTTAARVAPVLKGALAASVTPLRDGGAAIDEDGIGPVVDFLAAGGAAGRLGVREKRAGD